jgi:hypothetical protein
MKTCNSDRHGRHFDVDLPMTVMLELLAVAFILALAAMPVLAKDAGVPLRVVVPAPSAMSSSHVSSATTKGVRLVIQQRSVDCEALPAFMVMTPAAASGELVRDALGPMRMDRQG